MTRLQVLLHLGHLLVLGSAILQPPTHLRLSSVNFQHILTWEEPNNGSLIIYYCVEYSTDLGPFTPVTDCCNITYPLCDVTKYFTDIHGSYRTRLYSFTHKDASNNSYLPHELNPFTNTILGPPIVDVAACDSCINISIHPPVSYLWSEKEQRNVGMLSGDVYPVLDYTIQLWPSTETPIYRKAVSTENYTTSITSLLPNTNYCVSVMVFVDNNENAVASPKKCVVTKVYKVRGDGKIYAAVVFAIIIFIALLLILFSLDQAGFLCSKKIYAPKVLQSLPRWNSMLTRNNEFTPMESLISMETKRSNEETHINMARLSDNTSYIANNVDKIALDCQQSRTEDTESHGEGQVSKEHSAVLDKSTLGLSQVTSSEDPSNKHMVSSTEDNILKKHPKVNAVSDRRTRVPSHNTMIGISSRGTMASTRASHISQSLINPFDGRNIELNTVSLADPEDLCTKASLWGELEVSVCPYGDGDPLETKQFRLLTSGFEDEPTMVNPEYNNEKDTSNKDGSNEHLPFQYIKR